MGFIKGRHEYLFENISNSKLSEVYDIVEKYLTKHLGDIAEYGEDWVIDKKDGQKLKGRLFRTIDGKGIRFNWNQNDETSTIVSIDLWNEIEMLPELNNPSVTINLNQSSVTNGLKHIINYFKGVTNELHDPDVKPSVEENSKPLSLIGMSDEELNETTLDVFEEIKAKTYQVRYGYANSLMVTGQSGVGKTHTVKEVLKETKADYKFIKGGISTSGLFELLFERHNQFIVFDDCDNVMKETQSINILKAALDSYPEREVSRPLKTSFSTKGMDMEDIVANYQGDVSMAKKKHLFNIKNKGKMPKSFIFTGQVIFISNLKSHELDSNLVTRASAHIDIDLSHQEILDRMREVMSGMSSKLSLPEKEEVLELLDYLTINFVTRHPLSIRALVNALDTRFANDRPVNIKGKIYPMWQVLIKQDMLGKEVKRRDEVS